MAKPSLDLTGTTATTVSGTPLLYDSGIKYDDTSAYYNRWYPGDVVSNQGEIPTISASAEKTGLGSKQESVTIKTIEEL